MTQKLFEVDKQFENEIAAEAAYIARHMDHKGAADDYAALLVECKGELTRLLCRILADAHRGGVTAEAIAIIALHRLQRTRDGKQGPDRRGCRHLIFRRDPDPDNWAEPFLEAFIDQGIGYCGTPDPRSA